MVNKHYYLILICFIFYLSQGMLSHLEALIKDHLHLATLQLLQEVGEIRRLGEESNSLGTGNLCLEMEGRCMGREKMSTLFLTILVRKNRFRTDK